MILVGTRTRRKSPPVVMVDRPQIRGKFLWAGDEKIYLRGVTYGAFCPDADDQEYHDLEQIDADFAQMASVGINAVRIPHTMPPRALLDIAQRHGLRVMVGLSAEQYIGYLIDRKDAPDIEGIIRSKVRTVAGHPALLCYALGNEIPAALVRWLGRGRIERYLAQLYRAVKAEDPESIVTYVNYPTTEYLNLPFLDMLAFNVYLESQDRLEAYLARLQNIAGDRPLLMSEVGMDSLRNGEDVQACVLDWQIRTIFAAGCAGAFVFSWTDEWHRAGEPVDDWEFGITDRQRRPKPALTAVSEAFAEVPFPPNLHWPRISVVVCTYNGHRTIRQCFEGLQKLDYPNFEVIVVDDGSTDPMTETAEEYSFRLIRTENHGLSNARNIGLEAATGEIVAYIDDDAYPDPHWLKYLAAAFLHTKHVAVGGPNIAPAGTGAIADCVANAPGGPVHVLLSDSEAEHIPGCNMAFRKRALAAIGGFDPQFRAAGDDVDVCWRLQQRGWTLGFQAAAMVWHHRRNSVRTYWRQQRGYGVAEAMLEKKWPEKYNAPGHITWAGRVYSHTVAHLWSRTGRIYQGVWGTAPFQRLYQNRPDGMHVLPLMPEWHLVIWLLAALSVLGFLWKPLLWTMPLLLLAIGAILLPAGLSAARATFPTPHRSRLKRFTLRIVTALLHLIQPPARLVGRLGQGLSPWRRRGNGTKSLLPWPRTLRIWSECWQEPAARLERIEESLRAQHPGTLRGGEYDHWDLEVREGMLGAARLLFAAEDHAGSKQLIRVRCWPRCSLHGLALGVLFASLTIGSALEGAWVAAGLLSAASLLLVLWMVQECAAAVGVILSVFKEPESGAS
jgi:GT2 family glycosyltransferase